MTTTLNPLEAIERAISLSSRDWSKNRGDAALYGIVFGWDDDDGNPRNSAMAEVAAKVGWSPVDVERIRALHRAYLSAKRPKYAIYVTSSRGAIAYLLDDGGAITTDPAEAKLWDDVGDASTVASQRTACGAIERRWRRMSPVNDEAIVAQASHYIEVVKDEVEFRSRQNPGPNKA